MADRKSKNRILLAIPAYNEGRYLDRILDSVIPYIDDVLVMDDGSIDNTREILARRNDVLYVSCSKNCGYGQAIADIFYFARSWGYQWVITMDCDFQHEPQYITSFIEAIRADNADIISGSRYMAGSEVRDIPPQDRRYINQQIVNLLSDQLGLELTDAFCGFKAYRMQAIAKLELTEKGYAFPMEFWCQAVDKCLRIKEIPVSLVYNDPARHFGGELDDPARRLNHYYVVFEKSIARIRTKKHETLIYDQNSRTIPVSDTQTGWGTFGCTRAGAGKC